MKNQNFKTPIDEVFFRSSKIGLLAGGLIRHGLTEKQREKMDELELLKRTPIGLSEKQQLDLNVFDKKIKDGETLTPSQMEKRDDFKSRLKRPKGLTPIQEVKLQELKERNARPPELSQGAKTYVKEVWLKNEKGFYEEITDKKLKKGTQGEEDAINLISFVDGIMYIKNETRISKNHLTGECDVNSYFDKLETEDGELLEARVIDDTKCSWNPRTFMSASLTTGYEWQGRAYLNLYDADIFRLRHCLVNCPPNVFNDEYKRFCFQRGIIDDTIKDYHPEIIQFVKNYIYDFKSFMFNKIYYPETVVKLAQEIEFQYTIPERNKTFIFERDFGLEAVLLTSVQLAVEYYKTITLNMIENE